MADSRVLLITGAASGIGRHLTTQFVARGHRVIAADVDLPALEAAAQAQDWDTERTLLRQLDVREPPAWRAIVDEAIQKWQQIDVLLNVAGIVRPGFTHELSDAELARHVEINALGTMYGTRAVAEKMVARGAGHIINIASMAGIAPVPGIAAYTASKFAVRGFTLALAGELRPHGVDVSVICPDAVQTPMLDDELRYDEAAMVFSGSKPLSVDDVARAVDRALMKKPVEVVLPQSRAWLAKIASAFPWLSSRLIPRLWKKGEQTMAAARANTAARD